MEGVINGKTRICNAGKGRHDEYLPSETGKGMAVTECRGDCCQR